jgi:hypothetical protein
MSKLTGPALIVVGLLFLLFAYVSWDDAATEFGIGVHSTNPWWLFWRPNSYNVVTVPEFAIAYAILGTASLAAGTTLTIQGKPREPTTSADMR